MTIIAILRYTSVTMASDDIPNLLQNNKSNTPPNLSKTGDELNDLNTLPPLLTVREVAKILRVSPITIKRWTKRGRLPAIRINSRGDRRYRKETILYYLGAKVPQG